MRGWISTRCHEHPWLATALSVYLLLSAAETARNLLLSDPVDSHDEGFSAWREMRVADNDAERILFRWTAARSTLVRPVNGVVLGLLVIHERERPSQAPTRVTFSIDGEVLDEYTMLQDGRYSFRYYLPPILGSKAWSELQAALAERARVEAPVLNRRSARWQELHPWRRPPESPSLRIETNVGGAPAEDRGAPRAAQRPHSSVGIASVEWLDELPPDGAGFHPPESGADGIEFRWSRRWAALPLAIRGRTAMIPIRAIHPDIEQHPVMVDFFWNAELLRSLSLSTSAWTDVRVDMPPGAARNGVLSLRVSRTWSPARAGVSQDVRELGVAVAAIAWR